MYGRGYQQVRFGPPETPNVVKQLLIINVAIFVAQRLMPELTAWFAVTPVLFWTQGFFWQPFTYMWLHFDLWHLAFNMLALWMFGSPLAQAWGERRFLRFYLLCGAGAGLIIVAWPGLPALLSMPPWQSFVIPTLGASGAVFGVLLAYSLTWPDRTIMLLFPPIPVRAIWFIPLILGISFLSDTRGNISHAGHLGGVLVGWILFRRMSNQSLIPSTEQLRYRLRRWRMRRKLRAVQMEDERHRNDRRGGGRMH